MCRLSQSLRGALSGELMSRYCPKLSLPPMPHTSTLTFCRVALPSSLLSYSEGHMIIDGYSGGLSAELNKLKSIARLYFSECSITCPGLQDITCLESVKVKDCPNLFRWPIEAAHTIRPFPASLKELKIKGESGMQSMVLLSNLTCLTSLKLVDCENLTMDGFNPLIRVNLDDLMVYNTDKCLGRSVSADMFSELAGARTNLSLPTGSFRLRLLKVDCISAVLVAPICTLLAATLEVLIFIHDQRAESFTGEEERALELLTSLKFFTVRNCPNLPSLPQGLYSLPSLQQIVVGCCPQVQSLPKGPFPTSLKALRATGCSPELQEQIEKLEGSLPGFDTDSE
ncbi:unnamed protein product [Triticum turgidum subsp. durum]|uniref:Uncharacterized protein n=1 Tax=Triticum turgidum subsp. durum TaxID=4567 RepID=A0A9R1BUP3_TRITD|nr:unnamed protein product [Triticum turgidum subsp. durum]